jgi:hypothetical protein
MMTVTMAFSQEVPENFLFHKDTLVKVVKESWPDITMPTLIPGLIEQETCITLKHSKCWSRMAKLETSREYGFGLGQLTVTSRFNAFEEVKQLDSKLKGWQWDDRFNAEFQMTAIVAMLKRNYRVFRNAEKELDHYAFSLASYNGGVGGIQSDQRICRNTPGCNSNLWFGHTEHTSLKQKTVVKGYGQSFFQINRKYPVNVLLIRRMKYKPYIDKYFENVKL